MPSDTTTIYSLSGEEVLQKLLDGNQRYAASKRVHPNQTGERRRRLVAGQNPLATILGCSDSRVPPEIIFDQGLGDLFVLRVAGNVLNDMILGSIEYAVDHLRTPLVIVLGHSNCGAIEATIANDDLEGHLVSLATAIQPSVYDTRGKPGNVIDNTAKANARRVADKIKRSEPVLARTVRAGKVSVVTAFYKLDTGVVEIL
jgi:carbonic anhydrase